MSIIIGAYFPNIVAGGAQFFTWCRHSIGTSVRIHVAAGQENVGRQLHTGNQYHTQGGNAAEEERVDEQNNNDDEVVNSTT